MIKLGEKRKSERRLSCLLPAQEKTYQKFLKVEKDTDSQTTLTGKRLFSDRQLREKERKIYADGLRASGGMNMECIDKVPEYEIRKGLPVGTKTKGKIIDIKDGVYADFITDLDKYFAKSKGRGDPQDPVYCVTIESLKTGHKFDRLLAHPKANEPLGDRTKLYKFKLQNDAWPHMNQEVQLVVDSNGFETLLL